MYKLNFILPYSNVKVNCLPVRYNEQKYNCSHAFKRVARQAKPMSGVPRRAVPDPFGCGNMIGIIWATRKSKPVFLELRGAATPSRLIFPARASGPFWDSHYVYIIFISYLKLFLIFCFYFCLVLLFVSC